MELLGINFNLMDKIQTFNQRNPVMILRDIGGRLKRARLAKGWTRDELAERAGVGLSTLKLLETKGQASFLRLVRVAVALGLDGELRDLFGRQEAMESIDALKLAARKRAPRRPRKRVNHGA